MSSNCSQLIKEHGWKLWFSSFLGYSVLFWVISWVSTASAFPTNCSEFFATWESAFSSPMALVQFLVFAGLLLIPPTFLQAAGVSITNEAISRNQSSIDTYFSKGIANFSRMYQLTLATIVCYIPALLVSSFSSFEFSSFDLTTDNLTGLLSIALFLFTGLSLLHAPYILVSENTSPLNAIRQSSELFWNNATGVMVSLLNVVLISGVLLGTTYYFNPDILSTLHPMRFFVASLVVSLTIFAVTYRYFKRFKSSNQASCAPDSTCS